MIPCSCLFSIPVLQSCFPLILTSVNILMKLLCQYPQIGICELASTRRSFLNPELTLSHLEMCITSPKQWIAPGTVCSWGWTRLHSAILSSSHTVNGIFPTVHLMLCVCVFGLFDSDDIVSSHFQGGVNCYLGLQSLRNLEFALQKTIHFKLTSSSHEL